MRLPCVHMVHDPLVVTPYTRRPDRPRKTRIHSGAESPTPKEVCILLLNLTVLRRVALFISNASNIVLIVWNSAST